jgi:hypothetical protein
MLLYRATELFVYPVVRAYFRPEVAGLEHLPRKGCVIIAANHLSAADEVFIPVAAPPSCLLRQGRILHPTQVGITPDSPPRRADALIPDTRSQDDRIAAVSARF